MDGTPIAVALLDACADDDNPNVMDKTTFGLLRNAMKSTGFNQPVLVVKRGERYLIVDGAHRVRAARELGMTEVPCVERAWDDEQVKLIRIGMNKMRGELDLGRVAEQLTALRDNGLELDALTLSGFSEEELAALTQRVNTDSVDLGANAPAPPNDQPSTADKPHVLEIAFTDKKKMALAKKKLMQAAGETKDVARGLFAVLGEEWT